MAFQEKSTGFSELNAVNLLQHYFKGYESIFVLDSKHV